MISRRNIVRVDESLGFFLLDFKQYALDIFASSIFN